MTSIHLAIGLETMRSVRPIWGLDSPSQQIYVCQQLERDITVIFKIAIVQVVKKGRTNWRIPMLKAGVWTICNLYFHERSTGFYKSLYLALFACWPRRLLAWPRTRHHWTGFYASGLAGSGRRRAGSQ
jgi:hypothetical protein